MTEPQKRGAGPSVRSVSASLFLVVWVLVAPASQVTAEESGLPVACGAAATALPQFGEIHGQAESKAQLYYDPLTKEWYVSYQLETNSMSVGADVPAFFARVVAEDPHAHPPWDTFFEEGSLSGDCKLIGAVEGPVEYWVQGGATGWATSETCDYSIWAEFTAGIKFGPLGGPEVEATLGGSITCGNGAVLDSEILISEDNVGSQCPPLGCHARY